MTKREIEDLKVGSKRYRNIAIIIGFLGFIAGIIVGASYEEFNAVAMGYMWGSAAGTVILFSFMYSVCYRLDLLIEKKDK